MAGEETAAHSSVAEEPGGVAVVSLGTPTEGSGLSVTLEGAKSLSVNI